MPQQKSIQIVAERCEMRSTHRQWEKVVDKFVWPLCVCVRAHTDGGGFWIFSGFHIKYCKVGEHGFLPLPQFWLHFFHWIYFPCSKCQSDLKRYTYGSNAVCIELLWAGRNGTRWRCVCALHTKSVFEPKVTFHFEILIQYRFDGFDVWRKVFNKLLYNSRRIWRKWFGIGSIHLHERHKTPNFRLPIVATDKPYGFVYDLNFGHGF